VTPDALRRAAAHCFVDDLDQPTLRAEDERHLGRALRLRAGEAVTLSDGAGRWRLARFDGRGVEIDGDIAFVERPRPELAVAFALLKGDRSELVTQKLTELGIDEIVPMRAERTVVRGDDEWAARLTTRLDRVAREAAMQSRRVWLPTVASVAAAADLMAAGWPIADVAGRPPAAGTTRLLVGPEGGWSDAERAAARAAVGLGPGILRAETAAIAAATLLVGLRVGIVRPAD
jgi:16S rRNA (uracil1498-N3)-methyltransferase